MRVRDPYLRVLVFLLLRVKDSYAWGLSFLAFGVSREADQIQRQCFFFSVANTAIKGDFETIALAPNNGLLIQEGNSNSLLLQ